MFHRKWKKVDQAEFLIRIGQCLNRGYTLAGAIHMQTYDQSPRIKQKAAEILLELKNGQPISAVFLKSGFPKISCSFLFFSLQTGQLAQGFLEGGRYLKLKEAQKSKFNNLMRYPIFLLWMFGFMTYIIIHQLLPSFNQLYQSMSIDLPYGVKLLLSIPTHLGTLLIYLALVIGFFTLLITLYLKLVPLTKRLTHLAKTPFVSAFLKMYLSYYFAFHIGELLKVGLSVNDALRLIESQGFQPFFKIEAFEMRRSLINGDSLADIITKRMFYTRDLPIVIRNGEAQGQLGKMLYDYSQLVFTHLEEKVTKAMSMVQPLFLVLFGGLIVGLFLSILTPMFSIINGL